MCSGGNDRARRDAERRQREADKEAERRRQELEALQRQRQAQVAQQQRTMQNLQAQQQAVVTNQRAKAADLKRQQSERLTGLEATNTAERNRIAEEAAAMSGRMERAGNVASASLRVLGQKQPKAPTAQQTKRGVRAGGARTTSAGYSRGSASTKGTNLSI